jgi:GTP-binding protein Era
VEEQAFRSGFAAVVGRPNVGKSTLVNRLVGQKVAIMSDKPQTTRHKISAVVTTENAQVVFLDTPGVHKPKHRLGEQLVETALKALREVDLVLFLVEPELPGAGDLFIMDQLRQVDCPVFLVINKVDLASKDNLLPVIAGFAGRGKFAEVIPLSALTGDNVGRLVDLIISSLPPGPRYYPDDMVTDKPERFIVAEIIREKVLHLTGQEVPHAVTVVVERMEEQANGLVVVEAVIYVERDSQKGILIGKKGQMLKEIGRLARVEAEALLGSKIFLELWVKVKKDWRNRPADIKNFGYADE